LPERSAFVITGIRSLIPGMKQLLLFFASTARSGRADYADRLWSIPPRSLRKKSNYFYRTRHAIRITYGTRSQAVEQPHIIHLTSLDEMRENAAAWDDLWWRSETAMPTARAELIAQWIEQFRPCAEFRAIIVVREGHWIAALPLIACRIGGLMPAGALPGNAWSPCGDLLCDAAVEPESAVKLLLSAAARLPWQLLWLNDVLPETPRWQAALRLCNRLQLPASYHERYRVGRVEIGDSWVNYRKSLSKHHRQAMCRAARKLEREGNLRLEMNSRLEVAAVEPWLAEAFEIENLGWKGANGSSVLRAPGMFDFFVKQAKQLARWGQLETAALRLDNRMLAFIYGFRAKGVYFAHKISYDPRFASFSPGQLLFNYLLERLHDDEQADALDFIGPMNHCHSRWRPATYGVGRLALSPRGMIGHAAMYAYRHYRRLRRWKNPAESVNLPPADNEEIHVVPEPAGAAG